MASVYAIANGNWRDGSTWNTGIVPTVDDDVYINGHIVTCRIEQQTITVASLHFDTNPITLSAGGRLRYDYLTGISTLIINANIIGNNEDILERVNFTPQAYLINGNVTDVIISDNINPMTITVNGNVNNSRFNFNSGGGSASKTLHINGNINEMYIGGASNGVFYIYTNGNWRQQNEINKVTNPTNTPSFNFFLSGKFVPINFTFSQNWTFTIDCTIDLSNNSTFPIVSTKVTIVSLIILPAQVALPPESVVLKDYQYGDKTGTLEASGADENTLLKIFKKALIWFENRHEKHLKIT